MLTRRVISILMAACIVLSLCAGCAPPDNPQANVFYVAPDGNDAHSGSENYPFATLERAQKAVREINGDMAEDITVYLKGGMYHLSQTFCLDAADSGNNGHKVNWKAAPGETPVLSGGVPVTGWKQGENGIWQASVGETAGFRNLYVDGRRADRARSVYPSRDGTGWITDEISRVKGFHHRSDPTLEALVGEEHLEIFRHHIWRCTWLPVTSLEKTDTGLDFYLKRPNISIAVPDINNPTDFHYDRYFFVENALLLLDTPGEWFYDPKAQNVYYMPLPGQDMKRAQVYAPQLERILDIRGESVDDKIHDVVIEGLSFAHGAWTLASQEGVLIEQGALTSGIIPSDQPAYPSQMIPGNVHVEFARDIQLERCNFSLMGATALALRNAVTDTKVQGCTFRDLSDSAIAIGEPKHDNPATSSLQMCSDITIANNAIARVGREYFSACGIQVFYTHDVLITHNVITDCPYTGISLGWGWGISGNPDVGNNRIAKNIISRCNTVCWDGGNIYTLGRQPGSVLEENVLINLYGSGAAMYLDNGTQFIHAQRNICYNTGAWTFINHGAADNLLENNLTEFLESYDRGASPSTVQGTRFYNPDNPSDEALALLASAGLEEAYRDIAEVSAADQELARGKTVTASGLSNAAALVDGKVETLWEPGEAKDGPHTISIDLSGPYTLSHWTLYHEQAVARYGDYPENDYNLLDFKLEYSVDGENWKIADFVLGNRFAVTDRMLLGVTARYVRITILAENMAHDGNPVLREVEVYGHPAP